MKTRSAIPTVCLDTSTVFDAAPVAEAAAPESVAEAVFEAEGATVVVVALPAPAAAKHSFIASVVCCSVQDPEQCSGRWSTQHHIHNVFGGLHHTFSPMAMTIAFSTWVVGLVLGRALVSGYFDLFIGTFASTMLCKCEV